MPLAALAAPPEKMYYLGEIKLSGPTGQAYGSQAILVEKMHDPDKSTITEHAITVKADGTAEEWTSRMVVNPDNTFTLTDEAKGIAGKGQLFGPAWKWTYFKGTFKVKNGIQVDDENFMADDSVVAARKKVTGPDGKVMVYMDMNVKAITPKTFEILKTALLKK